MKILLSLFLILVSFPVLAEDTKESAFDRVIRTGVIRCAYYVFPPVTYRDPNTNELSGFSVDMMNEIAKRASLKIEWTEETNFANWIMGLQANRYDVACTPQWPDVSRGRAVSFTTPMYFEALYPLVREDDERFKGDDLSAFNDENVIFAAQDNDTTVSLIKSHFPKAQIKQLTTDGNIANFAMDVVTKKADAFVNTPNGQIEFNRNNPSKLRLVSPHHPLKWQPATLAVERHEMMLKDFLDNAIDDLINDGTMDRLLTKWEPEKGKTFLRVADPAKVVE